MHSQFDESKPLEIEKGSSFSFYVWGIVMEDLDKDDAPNIDPLKSEDIKDDDEQCEQDYDK